MYSCGKEDGNFVSFSGINLLTEPIRAVSWAPVSANLSWSDCSVWQTHNSSDPTRCQLDGTGTKKSIKI